MEIAELAEIILTEEIGAFHYLLRSQDPRFLVFLLLAVNLGFSAHDCVLIDFYFYLVSHVPHLLSYHYLL